LKKAAILQEKGFEPPDIMAGKGVRALKKKKKKGNFCVYKKEEAAIAADQKGFLERTEEGKEKGKEGSLLPLEERCSNVMTGG